MNHKHSKCLPGWEQYQSQEQQAKDRLDQMFDPMSYNPSNQEVSLKDRLASKLDSKERLEHGLEAVTPSVPLYLVAAKARKRR